MAPQNSKNERIKQFIQDLHQDEILDLSSNTDKNEGNIGLKEHTNTAVYKTKKLEYRTASFKYYDRNEITIVSDSYSQEISCLFTDKEIEKVKSDIPFAVYIRMMSSRAEKLELNIETLPIEELRMKLFENAEFQIRLFVKASDILEKRTKYELFHIEIMRRLKENHIEKGSLEFVFVDDDTDLTDAHISPEYIIPSDNELKKHILQRWVSIHNNKWYDLVKDTPENVLNYAKYIGK